MASIGGKQVLRDLALVTARILRDGCLKSLP